MKYDFSSIIDRSGTNAVAVEDMPVEGGVVKDGYSKIPMWVADMNFATVPKITEEICKRAEHPLFGYFNLSDDYYNAIINWQKIRNGADVTKECIGFENGVLGGVLSAINVFCSKGDNVLLHSPTYVGFTKVLTSNGYNIVHSPLVKDENGVWRMDYEDMDRKLKEYKIHAAVFCSPHNPTGRVWERWEIEKAMEVYKNNDCMVVSDEIWSDIILNGHKHIPTQSVSEDAKNRTVAMYAPSKTFNLAGIQGAYHIAYNKLINDRITKEGSLSHYNSCNVFSMAALIGAYSQEGREWLAELRSVLSDNINYACDYIAAHFKGVKVSKSEGTYMLFIDCTDWLKETGKTMEELLLAGVSVGVVWQDGRPFFGDNSIRMNLAVPHSLVIEAMDRLDKHVFNA